MHGNDGERQRDVNKFASVIRESPTRRMVSSRGGVIPRDAPMLYLCGENTLSLPSAGIFARVHVSVQIFVIGERQQGESARPLSLLIKLNRNRKAESKLHNYTGLPLSLAPIHTTFTLPLSFLFALFLSFSLFFFLSPLFIR